METEKLKTLQSILNKSFELLRSDLGNNVQTLHDKITCLLKKSISALGVEGVPQLLLFDPNSNHTVLDAFFVPHEKNNDLKNYLNEWRSSLLGYRLTDGSEGFEEHTFYLKYLNVVPAGESLFLFIDNATPLNIANEFILEYEYRVRKLYMGAHSKEGFIKPTEGGKERLSIATGYNAVLAKKVEDWFSSMIWVVSKWPERAGIPEITGILCFLFPPHNNDIEDKLFDMRDTLVSLSSTLQMVAFVSQSYIMSEAASSTPNRITTELTRHAWAELLEIKFDSNDDEDKKRTLIRLFNLPDELAKRFIMRGLIDTHIPKAVFAIYMGELLNACVIKEDENSYIQLIKNTLPSYKVVDDKKYWDSICSKLAVSIAYHCHIIYRTLNRESLSELLRHVLSFIDNVFKSNPNDAMINVACTALEETFKFAGENTWKIIEGLFDDLSSYFTSACNLERLVGTHLLALSTKKDHNMNIERILSSLGRIFSQFQCQGGNLPLKHRYRIFNMFEPHLRQKIIELAANNNGPISEQFILLDEHLKEVNITLDTMKNRLNTDNIDVIAVASGKGGSGKTTVALSIAVSRAQDHCNKVCIIDLDIFGPTLHYCMQEEQRPTYTFNDYVWGTYLPVFKDIVDSNADTKTEYNKIFRGRKYLEESFNQYVGDGNKLDKLLGKTCLPNLSIIPCSPREDLQEMMVPFIASWRAMQDLDYILHMLLKSLVSHGFTHVILDCPAEFKELTLLATKWTTIYGGKNVFVTTLAECSLLPMMQILSNAVHAKANNCIVVNRVRKLDEDYIGNKETFLDYLTITDNLDGHHSSALLKGMTQIVKCLKYRWNGVLENIFDKRSPRKIDIVSILRDSKMTEQFNELFVKE